MFQGKPQNAPARHPLVGTGMPEKCSVTFTQVCRVIQSGRYSIIFNLEPKSGLLGASWVSSGCVWVDLGVNFREWLPIHFPIILWLAAYWIRPWQGLREQRLMKTLSMMPALASQMISFTRYSTFTFRISNVSRTLNLWTVDIPLICVVDIDRTK